MATFNFHATAKPQDVAPFVAEHILQQLQAGKRVLWLLSGGSGGAVCVAASKLLAGHDLSNLFVTMSDERYGAVGHADENTAQLLEQGLTLPGATFYRPLTGKSRDATTADFAAWLNQTRQQVDYTFAVLGIGEDAHTSGIKPHSVATTSPEAAVDFTGEDFERITTTSAFLATLDEAVVQAFGSAKHAVLTQLKQREGSKEALPMLVIRTIPQVTVFSDHAKESA